MKNAPPALEGWQREGGQATGNAPNSSMMGRRSACRARAGEKRAAGFGGMAARRGRAMGSAPNSSMMGRRPAGASAAGWPGRRRGGGGLWGARRIRLRWDGGRRIERTQVKTRRRLWRVGGAEGAGYGERAEFVYDGAKVGVLSAQVKNAPPALEGWRRGGGGLWGTRRIRL